MKNIYFLKPVDAEGPIKIGCSKLPEKRIRQIEIWSPQLLEIVVVVPGDHREESVLHQMFGDDRLHGEWFNTSPRLRDVIAYCKRARKLPPLDYSLRPYNTRKSVMSRRSDPHVVQGKAEITSWVQSAERRVFTYWGIGCLRPKEIQEIMEAYRGFGTPLPSEEHRAILRDYVAKLRELPPADNTLASFDTWHRAITAKAA